MTRDGSIFYNPEQRCPVLEGKLKSLLGNLTNSSPTVARDMSRSGTCHWEFIGLLFVFEVEGLDLDFVEDLLGAGLTLRVFATIIFLCQVSQG